MTQRAGNRLTVEAVDIVLWAIVQRNTITWKAVRARWGVHKSTAFRWVKELEDARQRAQFLSIPKPSLLHESPPCAGFTIPVQRSTCNAGANAQ